MQRDGHDGNAFLRNSRSMWHLRLADVLEDDQLKIQHHLPLFVFEQFQTQEQNNGISSPGSSHSRESIWQ